MECYPIDIVTKKMCILCYVKTNYTDPLTELKDSQNIQISRAWV